MEEFFKGVAQGGPAALIRYMNDPEMLRKFSAKVEQYGVNVNPPQGAAGSTSPLS